MTKFLGAVRRILLWFLAFAFCGGINAQPSQPTTFQERMRRSPQLRSLMVEEFERTKRAAQKGDPAAQWRLAGFYVGGTVTPKDETNSVYWLKKSATAGFIPAQSELATRYETGRGVPQDYSQARRCYLSSAQADNRHDQYRLGYLYLYGLGGPKDVEQGISWLKKSAELNSADAQQELGQCYREGIGVPTNAVVAASWSRKAALQGDTKAQHQLGLCYFQGIGVPKDYVEAYKWLNLSSVSAENTDAKKSLAALEALMTKEQIAEAQKLCREFSPVVSLVPEWANRPLTNLFASPLPTDGNAP